MIAGVAASLAIVGLAAALFWLRRRHQDRAFLKQNVGTLPFHDLKRPPSDPIMPLIAPYLTPQAHPAFASFLPDVKPPKKERHVRRGEGEEAIVLPVLRRDSERGAMPVALEQ